MTGPEPTEPSPNADIEEIQADIERTRGQLGDTVSALSTKLDATKDIVDRSRAAALPSLTVVASLAGVTLVGIVWWRRRSRRRRR
jgi:cobalamin biosynthesis Mg chelatase CobN